MKKRYARPTVIIALVVLFGSLAGFLVLKNSGPDLKSLRQIEVARRTLKNVIQATGGVEALNKVDILPAVPGRIDKILVEEGQRVKRGQVLTWMSSTNRAALLDLAQYRNQAEYKHWEDTYKPTPIIAPVTGLITKRDVVPGMMVGAQTVLFSMSDRLVIRAQVDETDIGKIKEGMLTEISVDAYPAQVFNARVHLIGHDSQLVNSVNVYLAELWPVTDPDYLRSGMTANVNFLLDVRNDKLALPLWAVQGHESETVMLLDPRGAEVPVKLGVSDGKFVEVLSPEIKAGDKFLIKPVDLHLEARNNPFSGPTGKRKPSGR